MCWCRPGAPAGLHGDWWRTGTALLVQDGGALGTLVNLGFLLVLGVAAEQVSSRVCWLGCYLGAGLVGELAGRGLQVDYRTVWEFVHDEKLSYKKRRWSPASATGRT